MNRCIACDEQQIMSKNGIRCFCPQRLGNSSQFCQYVQNEPSCSFFVRYIDYLETVFCKMSINWDNSFVLVGCMVFFMILFFVHMLLKYFLMPNYITLMEMFPVSKFAYNFVFFGLFIRVPDFMIYWFSLIPINTVAFNLSLSGLIGCVLRGFIVGVLILCINGFYVRSVFWWSHMFLFLAGSIFVLYIVRIKYGIFNEPGPIYYNTHSLVISATLMLTLITFVRVFVLIVSNHEFRMKYKEIHKDDPEDTTSLASEPISELSEVAKYPLHPEIKSIVLWWDTVNGYAVMKDPKGVVIPFVPFYFVLANVIPVIDQYRPLNGWCKVINCLSLLTLPFVLLHYKTSFMFFLFVLISSWLLSFIIALAAEAQRECSPLMLGLSATLGITISTLILGILWGEMNNVAWQFMSMRFEGMLDELPMFYFNAGQNYAQGFLMYQLTKRGLYQAAYGLFMGCLIDIVYTALPLLTFSDFFNDKAFLMLLSNTETTCQFLACITLGVWLHVSMSGNEFRMSLFYYTLVMWATWFALACGCYHEWTHAFGSLFTVVTSHVHHWA